MNLDELRTPHPLRDADFAAIRARVKAEIAQREERPWLAMLLRFAFAASLLVLFVPYVRERAPEVPVVVAPAPVSSRALVEGPGRVERQARASRPARPGPSTHARDDTGASRIEIITADPTVRIIWITPKESS
jgi:hypothetical protein